MPSGIRSLVERAGARTATPFRVRFPDGAEYRNSEAPPAFTLFFRSDRSLRGSTLHGPVGVLEAYFDGEVDIEGSLPKALAFGMEGGIEPPTWLLRPRERRQR